MKMQLPFFVIQFRSNKTLEEVAEVLSQKLLSGVPFGGKEDTIRDEEPAVYVEKKILGCFFILMGGPGEEGYQFEMESDLPSDPMISTECFVDLSSYVTWLLQDVKEFKFEPGSQDQTNN